MTKLFFVSVVVLVFIQRMFEVRFSNRNVARIISEGGSERSSNYLPAVRLLHISWFLAMILEVYLLHRPFVPVLAAIGLVGAVAGQCLRYFSMRALGYRWTVPIMTIPRAPVVDSGIYRYLRHPNWLGVVLELALIPLIHSAYLTSIFFSLGNAFIMHKRINAEEEALSQDSNYEMAFKNRPRFIPKFSK